MRYSMLLFALMYLGLFDAHADFMDDAQANQKLMVACETSRAAIVRDMIGAWESVGLTVDHDFTVGSCELKGNKAYLNLPKHIEYTALFSGQPFKMYIDAVNKTKFGWEWADCTYEYRWRKTPVYDHLQNLIGYEYQFRSETSSNEFYQAFNFETRRQIPGTESSISRYLEFK